MGWEQTSARWEYSVQEVELRRNKKQSLSEALREYLELWDANGWELVSVVPSAMENFTLGGGARTSHVLVFFRRPRVTE